MYMLYIYILLLLLFVIIIIYIFYIHTYIFYIYIIINIKYTLFSDTLTLISKWQVPTDTAVTSFAFRSMVQIEIACKVWEVRTFQLMCGWLGPKTGGPKKDTLNHMCLIIWLIILYG